MLYYADMTITTRIYTALCGKLIGEDMFGNRYYTEKSTPKGRTKKRWVMFNGKAEPSKVPAEWHGWLHYTHDIPPGAGTHHHAWEKPHMPNLTGTTVAYGPKRAPTTSDYNAWKP